MLADCLVIRLAAVKMLDRCYLMVGVLPAPSFWAFCPPLPFLCPPLISLSLDWLVCIVSNTAAQTRSTQLHRPRSCREIPSIVQLRNDERFYRSQRMSSPSLFARTCPGCPAKDGWYGMLGRTIVCVYNPWQAGMFATIFFSTLSLLPPILSVFLSL